MGPPLRGIAPSVGVTGGEYRFARMMLLVQRLPSANWIRSMAKSALRKYWLTVRVSLVARTVPKKRANFAFPREFQPGQREKSPQNSPSNANLEFERAFSHSLGRALPVTTRKERPIAAAPAWSGRHHVSSSPELPIHWGRRIPST